MRIRAIRGQGLASLGDAFELDLDAEPLRDSGVFVIGGPTGAGKSTILDAMCLALFDRAPRVARAPQREAKLADVVKADAVKRGAGAAQRAEQAAPEREWIRASDPRSIVRRGARTAFAEVDFEGRRGGCYRARWEVKSVRRREGGWALGKPSISLAVLSGGRDTGSSVGVRAESESEGQGAASESRLRVGATKTEVLAQIEARLGLDFAQFCRSVLLPQGELASFLEAPDDERALLLERVTGTEMYSTLSRVVHVRASALARRVRESDLELEAVPRLSESEREQLDRTRKDAAVEAARASKRLAEIVASERAHETARVLATELAQAERELDEVTRQLGLWEPRREELARTRRARELRAEQAGVRALEQSMAQLERELDTARRQLESATPGLAQAEASLALARAELALREGQSGTLEAALTSHEAALAAWSERTGHEQALVHARHLAEGAAEQATGRERTARKALEAFEREGARIEGELLRLAGTGRDALATQTGAYEGAHVRHLEPHLEPLAALLRQELHEGAPCPVCGSAEHPRGYEEGLPAGLDARAALEAWQTRRALLAKRESIAHELTRAQATHALRHEEHARAQEVLAQARDTASAASAARTASREELERVHGAEPPAARRAAHAQGLAQLRRNCDALERQCAVLAATVERSRGVVASLEGRHEGLGPELARAEQALSAALVERGLGAMDLTRANELGDRELSSLTTELEGLDQRRDRQHAVVEERRRRFEVAREAIPAELPSREELEVARHAAERERTQAEQSRAVAESRLLDDAAAQAERERRIASLSALRAEVATWETLSRLIGSADGKKLRRIVQSMALDLLLSHANQQLLSLAPRYRLVRHATQAGSLALDVLDSELEGGPRATSSLSGGERFLVSLALALGLGTMTAERDDVGSLFLDEGFGSLDEESLEQALEALDALRQAGRQIGVVSHVARLSERFDVRVEVRPREPGASTVHVTTG